MGVLTLNPKEDSVRKTSSACMGLEAQATCLKTPSKIHLTWVAVKEFNLSYYSGKTLLITLYVSIYP